MPRPARPSLPRKWLRAAAVVPFLLFAGLGLSEATGVTNLRGTVIRLFSPRGTLVVEVDDPGVSVTIDDGDIVITGTGVKEIRVKPGEHKIQASKDGKLVRQELVTVSKNGRQVVRVSKEAGPMADVAKPEKPKPAELRPLDVRYIPADASAAVVVHPWRIVQSPLVAAMLPAGAADEMVKELGVKPEQIEQAIVFLQMGAAGGTPPPSAPPPSKDDWTALDSKEGRFSIRFPDKPKTSEQKTTLGTRQVFAAEADEGNMTFELSFVDFPKSSPIVGDLSRVDFATRALEFKPGFKDKKDIKLDKHLGAEVVLDDVQLKKFFVHRVYVLGDRLYPLEAMTRKARKPPAEFGRFFDSFTLTGDSAPPPAAPPADLNPLPGAILRFAEPVDGKRILNRLLKGLREEVREGKTYYRSSTGEGILGLPLAGSVPDERTVLVAPEPLLQKMLAAGRDGRSPLLDRLRQTNVTDEITGIVILETHRDLLRAVAGQFKGQLPPNLTDAASLPDHLVAATATVNLADKTLLKVSLESDSEDNVETLDNLAFKGLALVRKMYPDFRPTLIGRLPDKVAQPALAIVDQLYGGIQVVKEGKRLVVRLEKPDGLGTPPPKDAIASASFNDARGLNSNPVPGSPYPLDIPKRQGGIGEPGWVAPWEAHPDAVFQSKVVFEGDGALFLKGRPNFGPNYGRQLAQPQSGRFQVEYRVQVPAGTNYSLQIWKDRESGPFVAGPLGGAGDGHFGVFGVPDTGFKCVPGRWYKVTMRIDVPKQTWEFFVDDKRFESPKPLKFRAKVEYLAYLDFIVGQGGAYFDDLHVTRLPDD